MRLVFVLLVILNLAYFAWSTYLAPSQNKEKQQTQIELSGENALTIMLVSEIAPMDSPKASLERQGGQKLVGGYTDKSQAQALLQRLRTLGIEGSVTERVTEVSIDYLAYIPAGESKRLALRAIDELRENNINAALVENGMLDNIISLGVFSQELAASREVERANLLGFEAELQKIAQKQQRFWVSISTRSERLVDEQVVRALRIDFAEMRYLEE